MERKFDFVYNMNLPVFQLILNPIIDKSIRIQFYLFFGLLNKIFSMAGFYKVSVVWEYPKMMVLNFSCSYQYLV